MKRHTITEDVRECRTWRKQMPANMQELVDACVHPSKQHEYALKAAVPFLAPWLMKQGFPEKLETPDDFAKAEQAIQVVCGNRDTVFDLGYLGLLEYRMKPELVSHTITKAARETILATELTAWPHETPRMMQGAIILEAPPGETLLGQIVSIAYMGADKGIAGVTDNCRMMVYTEDDDEGACAIDAFRLEWDASDNATVKDSILKASLEDASVHRRAPIVYSDIQETQEVVSRSSILGFLLRFALLMQAEGSPLSTSHDKATLPDGRPCKPGQGYSKRTVRISPKPTPAPAVTPGEGGSHAPPVHPSGLVPKEVEVSGFLRRQPCGKEGKDRKWIYITAHKSTRYVHPERRVRVI